MPIFRGLCAVQNQNHFPPNMQPTRVGHFRVSTWLWHANKVNHANCLGFSSIVTTSSIQIEEEMSFTHLGSGLVVVSSLTVMRCKVEEPTFLGMAWKNFSGVWVFTTFVINMRKLEDNIALFLRQKHYSFKGYASPRDVTISFDWQWEAPASGTGKGTIWPRRQC